MSHSMITVRGLRYAYPKADEPAIDGLEFGVERAEILGAGRAAGSDSRKGHIRVFLRFSCLTGSIHENKID